MRMGNPSMRKWLNRSENGDLAVETTPATYGGIALKSVIYLLINIVAAVAAILLLRHSVAVENADMFVTILICAAVSVIPMIILSIIISFAPSTAPILGSIYSVFQGMTLGMIVFFVDLLIPGMALAAVLGTLIVFTIAVVLNRFLEAKITNKVLRIILISFAAVVLVEAIMAIVSLCVADYSGFFTVYFWWQFLATLFSVVYSTVLLMWDIQSANNLVQYGADKKYEWVVAFSLVTTLVYLYLELLELLIRLALIFGKNKD